ncbi:tyrosine-type recombinase/integrase [Micromonospora sp. NPDC047644]|uniref:tyrosine-type recombinase/integrase n=1 Tax=Micromonospora sp. NPDC047644 TaxID=3157203 RepID=UPI003453D5EE
MPDTATRRFSRMAARLGLATNLHALQHYSATELIAAGVDVRTVAGRLGHGGGGATTLRVYAAWLSESDQRAASALSARMPSRPRLR